MARKLRIEFPGAVYHVSSRSFLDKPILAKAEDRALLLETIGDACDRFGIRLHAFVVLESHYHLMVETPKANISKSVGWIQNTFGNRFVQRHVRRRGKLFGDRFKAVPVDRKERELIAGLADFIHLNPVRARLLEESEPVTDFPWSSARFYVQAPRNRPSYLTVDLVLEAMGLADTASGRREFRARLERLREAPLGSGKDPQGELERFRRGWYLGDARFRAAMLRELKKAAARPRPVPKPKKPRKPGEDVAAELVAEGLRMFQMDARELSRLPKSDPRKRVIGFVVKKTTRASLQWIGRRLQMGASPSVSRLCARLDGTDDPALRNRQARQLAASHGLSLPR